MRLVKIFPDEEQFGLTAQIRRAAVSIPSNIAEGHSCAGRKDYIQFVSIAIGSTAEVEAQLILAADLGFVHESDIQEILELIYEIQRMLHALRKSLRNPDP